MLYRTKPGSIQEQAKKLLKEGDPSFQMRRHMPSGASNEVRDVIDGFEILDSWHEWGQVFEGVAKALLADEEMLNNIDIKKIVGLLKQCKAVTDAATSG